MIRLLVLHHLNQKVLTMYGISKEIMSVFSVLTTPSLGTLQPALINLEKDGFIKSQKTISEGGRRSSFYSITKDGKLELKRIILEKPCENPVQFLPTSRVKLACADVLDEDEKKQLFKILKLKAESIMIDTKNLVKNSNFDFYERMVFDNLICEYKNFITLLEGFERAGNN